MHNNVFLRSLNHYTVDAFLEELQKISFSNYERASCIQFFLVFLAYNDFLNKLMKIANEIAQSKEKIRIKNNTQESFDREIAELMDAREKLFF